MKRKKGPATKADTAAQKKADDQKKKIPVASSMDDMTALVAGTYGSAALMTKCDVRVSRRTQFIPTTILELDLALGGGIPRGRSTMLWGFPSAGKSTLCMKIIAQFQRHCRICGLPYKYVSWKKTGEEWTDEDTGEVHEVLVLERRDCGCEDGIGIPMKCAYIAIERSFDPAWAMLWGVNLDELYLMEPEYAEQAMDMGSMALSTDDCDLLVLDSVAQMVPSEELAVTAEKWQTALQPRLMGKTARTWGSKLHSFGTITRPTIVMTNQVRNKVGPYGGLSMPGGNQLEHTQDVIIRVQSLGDIMTENDIVVGQETEFLVKKTKLSPPRRTGSYVFYFMDDPECNPPRFRAGEFNTLQQLVKVAVVWGIVVKAGSWFEVPGLKKKVQGIDGVVEALANDYALFTSVRAQVVSREKKYAVGSQILPPEFRLGLEEDALESQEEDFE